MVLLPTGHKIGHFGDVSLSQSLGLVWKKLNVTTKSMHLPTKRNILQHKIKTKLKPGLFTFYDIWPGNGAGLFSEEKNKYARVSASPMIRDFQQTTMASIGLLAQANTVCCGNLANCAAVPPRPSPCSQA